MHSKILKILAARKELATARKALHDAKYAAGVEHFQTEDSSAENYPPLPKRLRPSIKSDIREEAVIWYTSCDEERGYFFEIVDEVLNPGCEWKAYFGALTGSRYGLNGAFVEDEKNDEKTK